MNQVIVFDYPPMIDEIDAAFHVRGQAIIYAWGDRIYNPRRVPVYDELLAHEAVHGRRQTTDEEAIREWWLKYIGDPQFRLREEVFAHKAEYIYMMENGNHHIRKLALKQTAAKLSSPLYGKMISPGKARALLRKAHAKHKAEQL